MIRLLKSLSLLLCASAYASAAIIDTFMVTAGNDPDEVGSDFGIVFGITPPTVDPIGSSRILQAFQHTRFPTTAHVKISDGVARFDSASGGYGVLQYNMPTGSFFDASPNGEDHFRLSFDSITGTADAQITLLLTAYNAGSPTGRTDSLLFPLAPGGMDIDIPFSAFQTSGTPFDFNHLTGFRVELGTYMPFPPYPALGSSTVAKLTSIETVPEPSISCLLALSGMTVTARRRRRNR